MDAYVTHSGSNTEISDTKQRLLIEFGWRYFMTPHHHNKTDIPYALDNGAWEAYQSKQPFREADFMRLVETYWEKADFIIAPDIVQGGLASLELSLSWLPRLPREKLCLLSVQDDMTAEDLAPYLKPERTGLFLGGSTEWKLATGTYWGEVARKHGVHYHVGRVNTYRRVIWCRGIGANSFDGTSVTRYSKNIHRLDAARRQNVFIDPGKRI